MPTASVSKAATALPALPIARPEYEHRFVVRNAYQKLPQLIRNTWRLKPIILMQAIHFAKERSRIAKSSPAN